MANFRQVKTQLWNDVKFLEVSPEAKLLFIWTFTHPDTNCSGLTLFNDDVCMRQTSLSRKVMEKAMLELIEIAMVEYDKKYNILWVMNQFKHAPKSPKIVEAVIREILSLPNSATIDHFMRRYDTVFWPYCIEGQHDIRNPRDLYADINK